MKNSDTTAISRCGVDSDFSGGCRAGQTRMFSVVVTEGNHLGVDSMVHLQGEHRDQHLAAIELNLGVFIQVYPTDSLSTLNDLI